MDYKGYILSIVGAVLLGVVTELVMPTGKMNKFVHGVVAVFTFYIIISPLFSLFSSGNILNDNSLAKIEISVLENVEKRTILAKQKSISNSLYKTYGVECDVEISYRFENNEATITACDIFFNSLVFEEGVAHKDIISQIQTMIAELLAIEEGKVSVYD